MIEEGHVGFTRLEMTDHGVDKCATFFGGWISQQAAINEDHCANQRLRGMHVSDARIEPKLFNAADQKDSPIRPSVHNKNIGVKNARRGTQNGAKEVDV